MSSAKSIFIEVIFVTQEEVLELLARIDIELTKKHVKKAEFYSAVGLTAGALSLWRKGKTKPRPATIEKIADYLGVTPAYLMGEEPEKSAAPQGSAMNDDDIKFALWGTREIDDDVLEQVKAFAKFASEHKKKNQHT